ncbi:MAG: nucleoside 2-deoxyribosyltransferase [Colwellia sp.]
MNKKIKIYLSARIDPEVHDWNNYVCGVLNEPLDVFLPQDHNPYNSSHLTFEKGVFDIDLKAMIESDFGLLLPPYGRDCAWEVGWYANSNKPLIVYVHDQREWLRDWMIKGGLDYVFTTSPENFELLRKDPILKHKSVEFIEDVSDLKRKFVSLYNEKNICFESSEERLDVVEFG